MGGLMSSYNIQAPATLVYNLDAAALGGRVGTTITTSASFDGTTQFLSTTGLLATGVGTSATGTKFHCDSQRDLLHVG